MNLKTLVSNCRKKRNIRQHTVGENKKKGHISWNQGIGLKLQERERGGKRVCYLVFCQFFFSFDHAIIVCCGTLRKVHTSKVLLFMVWSNDDDVYLDGKTGA